MKLLLHTETFIDSCHYLIGYSGKCSEPHGHSWKIEVWILGDSSQCDTVGILFDFSNIKKIKEKYDHKTLNKISPFDKINPTAENLCQIFYHELKNMKTNLHFKVKVYETLTDKETWCMCGDFGNE